MNSLPQRNNPVSSPLVAATVAASGANVAVSSLCSNKQVRGTTRQRRRRRRYHRRSTNDEFGKSILVRMHRDFSQLLVLVQRISWLQQRLVMFTGQDWTSKQELPKYELPAGGIVESIKRLNAIELGDLSKYEVLRGRCCITDAIIDDWIRILNREVSDMSRLYNTFDPRRRSSRTTGVLQAMSVQQVSESNKSVQVRSNRSLLPPLNQAESGVKELHANNLPGMYKFDVPQHKVGKLSSSTVSTRQLQAQGQNEYLVEEEWENIYCLQDPASSATPAKVDDTGNDSQFYGECWIDTEDIDLLLGVENPEGMISNIFREWTQNNEGENSEREESSEELGGSLEIAEFGEESMEVWAKGLGLSWE